MRKDKGNSTAIIVFLILVAAAAIVYFIWAGRSTTTPVTDKTTKEIQTQGASTEVSAIESDLNATSFTSIDSDLSDIETELNAALSE